MFHILIWINQNLKRRKSILPSTQIKVMDDLSCVMELKFPRNGQVPESMFSFCKDIAFLEQLSESGFKSAYFIAVADDPLFYSGDASGIYGLYRNKQEITGAIQKPTGKKDKTINIKGSYTARWEPVSKRNKILFNQGQRLTMPLTRTIKSDVSLRYTLLLIFGYGWYYVSR